MSALATTQTPIFDIPHPFRIPTGQHLRYKVCIVGGLIPGMSLLKRLPVIGEDLLEDTPVPCRCDEHLGPPSLKDVRWLRCPGCSTPAALCPPLMETITTCTSMRKNAISYTMYVQPVLRNHRHDRQEGFWHPDRPDKRGKKVLPIVQCLANPTKRNPYGDDT